MSILRVYYSIIYRLCNTQHTSASTHPLLNADADADADVYFITNADADAEADVQFITTADADADEDVKEYADVPRMRMRMRISDTSLFHI